LFITLKLVVRFGFIFSQFDAKYLLFIKDNRSYCSFTRRKGKVLFRNSVDQGDNDGK
jgi:hypothetical protein